MKMVILAAGLGTRLRATLGGRSKLFADLGGETVLDRFLDLGRELGLDPIIVIRPEYAADFCRVPAQVLVEERPVNLLTTLYQTRHLIPEDEPFVWVGGDMVFTDTALLRELIEGHRLADFASFLVCRTDRFKAKVRFEPRLEFDVTREGVWSLSIPTLAVQSPRVFPLLEARLDSVYPLMSVIAAGETVSFREYSPRIFEIDTPLDLAEAQAYFARARLCA